MILNRIGRRQILLFLLASLSALLTFKNRDKASGSMRVRPPAAPTKGWTCNLFFAANRKIFLMRQNSSWKLWKGKRPKLLNWPVHEVNLWITFTIFELFKGVLFIINGWRWGGAAFSFLWTGRPSLPASLFTTPSAKYSSILKHKPSLAKTSPSQTPTSLPSTYKVSEMENFKSLMKQRLDTMKQQCEILRIVPGHCLNDKTWYTFFDYSVIAESFKSCGRLEVRRP